MTTYRWMLTAALAFSVTSFGCDNGGEDTGGNEESSGAPSTDDDDDDDDDDDSEGDPSTGEDTTGTSSTTTATTDDSSDSSGDVDFATQIQPIFDTSCATSGCHNGTFIPDLRAGMAYDSIVGVDSAVSGIPQVAPGDADGSYLFQRVTGEVQPQMPWLLDPLPAAEIDLIEDWINAGAPE